MLEGLAPFILLGNSSYKRKIDHFALVVDEDAVESKISICTLKAIQVLVMVVFVRQTWRLPNGTRKLSIVVIVQ